jgi:hypothetical protein
MIEQYCNVSPSDRITLEQYCNVSPSDRITLQKPSQLKIMTCYCLDMWKRTVLIRRIAGTMIGLVWLVLEDWRNVPLTLPKLWSHINQLRYQLSCIDLTFSSWFWSTVSIFGWICALYKSSYLNFWFWSSSVL